MYIPFSNLAGLMSMPIIREAPAVLHPTATAKPTAPKPQMAQVLPFSTFAVFKAAPYPVDTPQPNKQTLSNGADGSTYFKCLKIFLLLIIFIPRATFFLPKVFFINNQRGMQIHSLF